MFARPTLAIVLVMSTVVATGAPLAAQSGNFGLASAAADGEVFVGQPANFYGAGAVHIYRVDPMGVWQESARLFSPDSAHGDAFGRGLAADGGWLIVGAPADGDRPGAVHVYTRGSGASSSWTTTGSLTEPAPSTPSAFGTAVALQEQTAFVGAPGAAGGGVVHELRIQGGAPTIASTLRPSALQAASGFGEALSLDDDRLLVGAPGTDSGAGAAVLFRRHADGTWNEERVLSGDQPEARAGSAVLLDGQRAYVGAPRGAGGSGAVLVYELVGDDWQLRDRLYPFDAPRGGLFGNALAAADDEVWVGAPRAGGGDGAVYQFAADPDGGWSDVHRLLPDSANTGAWPFGFGTSLAIDQTVAVVGMPQRDFGEGRAVALTRTNAHEWSSSDPLTGEIFTAVSSVDPVDCTDGKIAVFDCSNMELVSFMPVDQLGGARGVWVNDVWGWTDPETGKDYALVSRRDGAAFVDVSNAAQPRLIGTLPRTAGSRPSVWRDIKVYNNHAYVVSDGAGAHGVQVFDLTRLRSVTDAPVTFAEDGHYDRIHSAHNIVADTLSGFLYVVGASGGGETCSGGLHMLDATNPKQPTFAGCYTDGTNARGYTHDAQCVVYQGPDSRYQGRQICIGSNESEINIADVTDKGSPVPIGRGSYPNVAYAHQGWFDEDQRYFYMGDEGDEVQGNVPGTRTIVWDLSQLDDPVVVKEYIGPVQATDHNLFIKDDRVYMSNYGSGLRVVDISDRENPQEVAFFDSAPMGDNEAGMSSTASGAWSNYPFFESGLVVFTSVREGLFIVRVKPTPLVP